MRSFDQSDLRDRGGAGCQLPVLRHGLAGSCPGYRQRNSDHHCRQRGRCCACFHRCRCHLLSMNREPREAPMEAQIRTRRPIKLAAVLSLALALTPLRATADDTDIFAGSSSGVAGNPNVLIILDNTSNWSTASQHWPDGNKQGQAELLAMRTVIGNLGGSPSVDAPINVGLMM